MPKVLKIIWLVNNLRNKLMSGNTQKCNFEKSYYVLNKCSKKRLIFKNSKK